MNKILIFDLWRTFLIPMIQPKLKVLSELRSVSKSFKELIPKSTSTYLDVPSMEYPNLESAYQKIKSILDRKQMPPSVFLDSGEYTIGEITNPMVIIGRDKNTTKITNGIHFKMLEFVENYSATIENITITNFQDSRTNDSTGITLRTLKKFKIGSNFPKLTVNSCNIKNCYNAGIQCFRGILDISNCDIHHNKVGIHIVDSTFKISNCNSYNNVRGIVVGNLYQKKGYLNNIRCFSNSADGISVGGWDGGTIFIKGNKTEIFNNGCDSSGIVPYCAGINTDYAGRVIFENLSKEVCHHNIHNYLKRNFKHMLQQAILFKKDNIYRGITSGDDTRYTHMDNNFVLS